MKNLKKIILFAFSISLLSTFYPIQSIASDSAYPSSSMVTKTIGSKVSGILLLRLNKIKALDKSNLMSAEKKVLRKEARSIKQELQRRGRVAIPFAAVLLVAILIIVFF